MKAIVAGAVAATIAFSVSAFAAPPQRIRGTLVSATDSTATVRTLAGQIDTIMLTPKTGYVAATKGSLSDVQAGKFIGTATKNAGGQEIALEVAVFPESMRGAGEGHYPWDTVADTTMPTPRATSSSMTNGNVSSAMPAHTTASSMTNGNVATVGAGGGAKTLTVTYNGGTQTILVPANAPIVLLAPANHSVLQAGASVMVIAGGSAAQMSAIKVIVGTGGTKLPM